MNTLFKPLDEIAIERLQAFEPKDGYILAYSGGKDSDVILDLTNRSGVRYVAHHHLTTCDPPEAVRHVKSHPEVIIDKPEMTMWQLIRHKGMPPRRNMRYCCEKLKERRHSGITITGIRWNESARRSKRHMIESCWRWKDTKYLNVIIDWTDYDIWTYIKERHIKVCSLYAEGFKRIGCILCPMNRNTELQIRRWPQLARAWERAIKSTYNPNKESVRHRWDSAEDYWQWWLNRDGAALTIDECLFRQPSGSPTMGQEKT